MHEPSKAYAAFCVFRQLGPVRTLSEAYRRWKAEADGQPIGTSPLLSGVPQDLEIDGVDGGPASNWKRWRKVWDWDERAGAYDAEREQQRHAREQAEELEGYDRRRQQRKLLDEIHHARILKLNQLIDETLAKPFEKMRQEKETQGVRITREVNAPEIFEVLSEQTADLEKRYFRGVGDSLQPDAGAGAQAEAITQFEWVANPEIVEAARVMAEATEGIRRQAEAKESKGDA